MNRKLILGIDLGTTRAKVMLADRKGCQAGFGSAELNTIVPEAGRAEQDPLVVWDSIYNLIAATLSSNKIKSEQIAAIGIANQRETTVVWNKKTGLPYGNAVLWLDKRADELCGRMSEIIGSGIVDRVGMYTIPNTSAMILAWLLQNDRSVMEGVDKGEALFGTMNSWLLWKLTGGEVHCCDHANMSVTQLQNANELSYDKEVIDILGIPEQILPELRGTGENFGMTDRKLFSGTRIPVAGMLGDQMAAALGQGCVKPGMVKTTYGTGSFTVMNTGSRYVPPAGGLLSPLLWGGRNNPEYGLEGFYEIQGARTEKAVLEEMARKTADIVRNMEKVSGLKINTLRIDGGTASNDYFCQLQADILGNR
jgi:glycerol kinase